MIRTRVNNPERVFLNSSDDPRTSDQQQFNVFTCTYDTPILGAKKTMLLRASIPNCQVNIPDYMLCFFYYSLTSATQVPGPANLKVIRLYPSTYQPAAGFTAYTKNRLFSDPVDFVTALNAAASAGGDSVTYNPTWVAGDVTFAYNATTKQISFTGNTVGRWYVPCGWADPNEVYACQFNTQAGVAWAANTPYAAGTVVTNAGTRYVALNGSAGTAGFNTDGSLTQITSQITMANFSGVGSTPQPLVPYYPMNLRVGYALSGVANVPGVNQAATNNPLWANATNSTYAQGTAVPADSYPNLVYTQAVYLYSNIVAGVSLGSNKTHNILSVIPVNAPQLGVIQYTALTVNMLSKLVDTIYEITVDMRDDNNQPFSLPDSANVNLELAFVYTE